MRVTIFDMQGINFIEVNPAFWDFNSALDPQARRNMIRGLGRGLRRSGGSLRELMAKSEKRAEMKAVFDHLARDLANEGDISARVETIEIVGLGPVESAMASFPGLLDARQAGEIQLAALRAIGELPDARVGRVVIDHWKSLSPTVRREAAEILFARTDRLLALLDAMESGAIAANELDAIRAAQLLAHRETAIRTRAKRLFTGSTRADRGQVIETMRPALSLTGDRAKGLAVFQKSCATCHKAEGQGESVGPDLSTITGRSSEDLFMHILDPNREVSPTYLNYQVATTDGRIFSGLIVNETANDVTLKRAGGVADVIPRSRIEAISSTGVSLMPEGLEKGLTNQDFADLIAYLRTSNAKSP